MERYQALNILAQPADMAIGLVMKTAQAAGAYEPVRDWLYQKLKKNMLAGLKKRNALEVFGLENIPDQGGALLAANHQSWLDVRVWAAACHRKIHFIAKHEFTDWPILNKVIQLSESMYLDDFSREDIIARLHEGWLVGMFPEGAIPGEGEIGRDLLEPETGLLPGRPDLVQLAVLAGVPVIPVGISGTGQAFPPEAYPNLEMPPLQKPVPITVRFGEPISFNEHSIESLDEAGIQALTRRVMESISALVDHHRCFIPMDVPLKKTDISGLKSYPATGKKAPFGALVLHGFTSHLSCVSGLEPYLRDLGLPYRFPILRGHGTSPRDLINVTADHWFQDAENALLELGEFCDRVIVCGLSMGGLVALDLGMKHPELVSNVVLIAPALKFADPLSSLSPVLSKIFTFWDSPESFHDDALAREFNKNYPVFATDAFSSLYDYAKDIEKNLKNFDRPVLIVHSRKDQVISPKAAETIFNKISTPKNAKNIAWFKKSGHEMCLDLEAEAVLETIATYIEDQSII